MLGPGNYISLEAGLVTFGMLQESFGLLSCFTPTEVGCFIQERYLPFPVSTTLAPYRTFEEAQKHEWDDV
eukprot:3786467-Prorocentrum_lima.AAC.1